MQTDLQLVALSAGEMEPAQKAIGDWCDQKGKALNAELDDLQEHFLIASNNGWKLRGLQAAMNRTAKRIDYYAKMKAAIDAGFLIVPNFPVSVLAVRVARDKQPEERSGSSWHAFAANPQLLPAGEGRYVDDTLLRVELAHQQKQPDGTVKTIHEYISSSYDAPDFPFTAVKPAVLDATQRAMALKVFDTIGMVDNRSGRDPIIVGQLLDPRGNHRCATFFIAWWLNTETL